MGDILFVWQNHYIIGNIYSFIWLCRVLVAAREIFIAALRLTTCGMWAPLLFSM